MGKTSVGNPQPLHVWGVQSGAGRVRARYVPQRRRRYYPRRKYRTQRGSGLFG